MVAARFADTAVLTHGCAIKDEDTDEVLWCKCLVSLSSTCVDCQVFQLLKVAMAMCKVLKFTHLIFVWLMIARLFEVLRVADVIAQFRRKGCRNAYYVNCNFFVHVFAFIKDQGGFIMLFFLKFYLQKFLIMKWSQVWDSENSSRSLLPFPLRIFGASLHLFSTPFILKKSLKATSLCGIRKICGLFWGYLLKNYLCYFSYRFIVVLMSLSEWFTVSNQIPWVFDRSL